MPSWLRSWFFEANVLETESIAAAVKGALAWSKETGKEIGGVIAAAGVSTPAKVRLGFIMTIHP
jgi:3-hydroxyacyl-CoA dehydrogenase/3-hydroxy-2-methylbutyryl-CoA dehydrogenase